MSEDGCSMRVVCLKEKNLRPDVKVGELLCDLARPILICGGTGRTRV